MKARPQEVPRPCGARAQGGLAPLDQDPYDVSKGSRSFGTDLGGAVVSDKTLNSPQADWMPVPAHLEHLGALQATRPYSTPPPLDRPSEQPASA